MRISLAVVAYLYCPREFRDAWSELTIEIKREKNKLGFTGNATTFPAHVDWAQYKCI